MSRKNRKSTQDLFTNMFMKGIRWDVIDKEIEKSYKKDADGNTIYEPTPGLKIIEKMGK